MKRRFKFHNASRVPSPPYQRVLTRVLCVSYSRRPYSVWYVLGTAHDSLAKSIYTVSYEGKEWHVHSQPFKVGFGGYDSTTEWDCRADLERM